MRLISAEEAKTALLGWETDPTDEEIEYTLDRLPTIDAVPVVRCKDCVYNKNGGCTQSEEYDGNYRPDYFCADGERGSDD